jgi:hypothetical protein
MTREETLQSVAVSGPREVEQVEGRFWFQAAGRLARGLCGTQGVFSHRIWPHARYTFAGGSAWPSGRSYWPPTTARLGGVTVAIMDGPNAARYVECAARRRIP